MLNLLKGHMSKIIATTALIAILGMGGVLYKTRMENKILLSDNKVLGQKVTILEEVNKTNLQTIAQLKLDKERSDKIIAEFNEFRNNLNTDHKIHVDNIKQIVTTDAETNTRPISPVIKYAVDSILKGDTHE